MNDHERIEIEESRILLQRSSLDRLFPVLRRGLYYLTGAEGIAGIRRTGYIEPNDGRFPDTYPQSVHSYGRTRGYVSLFDFEGPTEAQCLLQRSKWEGFFTRHKPATVLIGFDRSQLAPNLIFYEEAIEEAGYKPMKIPFVEVWYPEPIPLYYASKLVLIISTEPVKFEVFDYDEEGLQEFDRALSSVKEIKIREKTPLDIVAAWLHANRSEE